LSRHGRLASLLRVKARQATAADDRLSGRDAGGQLSRRLPLKWTNRANRLERCCAVADGRDFISDVGKLGTVQCSIWDFVWASCLATRDDGAAQKHSPSAHRRRNLYPAFPRTVCDEATLRARRSSVAMSYTRSPARIAQPAHTPNLGQSACVRFQARQIPPLTRPAQDYAGNLRASVLPNPTALAPEVQWMREGR